MTLPSAHPWPQIPCPVCRGDGALEYGHPGAPHGRMAMCPECGGGGTVDAKAPQLNDEGIP